ncbi:hypothetical protein H4582DRAFT_1971537 [Lactarius indigo]|nr:hypothetical protein H4582DRAFT_1971537 [Lactarius indigo]
MSKWSSAGRGSLTRSVSACCPHPGSISDISFDATFTSPTRSDEITLNYGMTHAPCVSTVETERKCPVSLAMRWPL